MALPYTHDDTTRIHDIAIVKWLQTLLVHYPEIVNPVDPSNIIQEKKNHPIICVKASPNRAAASIVDTLIFQNWIPETSGQALRDKAKDNLAVLPLPACSWQRSDPRPDPEQSNPAFVWQKGYFNCDTQKWEYYRWPKSWLTEYTSTFWGVKEATKAFWMEWVQAQFGNIGAGINETFLEIEHKQPFGTIKQKLTFNGLEDLSELEGDEQRYVRSELSVTLRTWITMPALLNPPGTGGPCGDGEGNTDDTDNGIGTPIYYIGLDFDVCGEMLQVPTRFYQTWNLWPGLIRPWPLSIICREWPTEDNGKIHTQDKQVFDITVTEPTDRVQLFGLPVLQDSNGLAIIGYSFDYEASHAVDFQVEKVDGSDENDTPVLAYETTLPASALTKSFHQFFLVDESIAFAWVRGKGAPKQEITLRNIDLRLIGTLPPIIGTRVVAGSNHRYEFTNLAEGAYLVIVRYDATPGGPYTVTLANDVVSPDHVAVGVADISKTSIGVVLMNQPKTDSMVLTINASVNITALWAQPYEGYYNGHQI